METLTVEQLQERVDLKKSIIKKEEAKLKRYRKLAATYNEKVISQIKWINGWVGERAEYEDRLREAKK